MVYKKNDQKNLSQQNILLKIKLDFLENWFKNLFETLQKERQYLQGKDSFLIRKFKSLSLRIIKFKQETISLSRKNNFLNLKIRNSQNSSKENKFLVEKLEEYKIFVESLFESSAELFKIFKTLLKILNKNSYFFKKSEKKIIFDSSLPEIVNSKIILLKYHKIQSLVWEGYSNKEQITSEIPLVLDFNGEDFYFYSSGIKEICTTSRSRRQWLNFKTKLNFSNKEKLILSFSEFINQKNLFHKMILLRLKIDFLDNSIKLLNKILEEKNKKNSLYKEIINFNKNFNSLYKKSIFLEKQIKEYEEQPLYKEENIKILQKENVYLEKKLEIYDNKIEKFYKNSNWLFNALNNLDNENIYKKQVLIFNIYKNNDKAILLKFKRNYSLVWWLVSEEDKNRNEIPLILNFNFQKLFLYSTEIKIDQSKARTNKKWINFKTKLDYNSQEKIIKQFSKYTDQNKSFYRVILLKLNLDFLSTTCIEILKALRKEKKFLNKQDVFWVTEINYLYFEIRNLVDNVNILSGKLSFFYKKIEKYNDIEIDITIPSTSENLDLKIELEKEYIKIAVLIKRKNDLIKKIECLINYLKTNNQKSYLENLHFKSEDQNLEENTINLIDSTSPKRKKLSSDSIQLADEISSNFDQQLFCDNRILPVENNGSVVLDQSQVLTQSANTLFDLDSQVFQPSTNNMVDNQEEFQFNLETQNHSQYQYNDNSILPVENNGSVVLDQSQVLTQNTSTLFDLDSQVFQPSINNMVDNQQQLQLIFSDQDMADLAIEKYSYLDSDSLFELIVKENELSNFLNYDLIDH